MDTITLIKSYENMTMPHLTLRLRGDHVAVIFIDGKRVSNC